MKSTLLEATQEILSSLDSDEVNSINDTVESYQVALLLKAVFYDMCVDIDLLEHHTTFGLEASGDADKPVLMTKPSNVTRIDTISYNIQTEDETNANYQPITYVPFDEFIKRMQGLREQTTGVDEMTVEGENGDTFTVLYTTDRAPQIYTTFDDETVLFDSYDSDVDSTLQQSKTLCVGVTYPSFTMEDDFTPDIEPTQFRYWINRGKVRAFAELKQAPNQEAASEARRQKIIVQKRKHNIATRPDVFNVTARYGRK